MTKARILLWDIESTGLKMDFATVLCIGYKWLDEKQVHMLSITKPGDDKKLIRDFIKIYNSASMTVTYFGTGFDRKAIIAKALEHNLELPANIPMVDLFYTVKSNMAISRKSLQNVGYYMGLSNEKSPVEGKIWRKAMWGHGPSLKYIQKHCRADVLLLEEAYTKLRTLVRTHPRVAGLGPCRFCGGTELQRRGRVINTLKSEKQRVMCKSCGGWDQRDLPKGVL